MPHLTPEGLRSVTEAAARHGVSVDAALALLRALAQGNGQQAQFNHPDLGGMGQWSRGGMIMIGDMFNHGLKARVDALASDLAGLLHSQPLTQPESVRFQSQAAGEGVSLFVPGAGASTQWWPRELGSPASTGAQNDMRYACFPDRGRLAVQQGAEVRVYDTGEHRISGFSQQQGGDQSLSFTSQLGLVRVADLALVGQPDDRGQNPAPPAASRPDTPQSQPPAAPSSLEDVMKAIERLAELRKKDILTEEEFVSKKTELLSRI
jgi:hypothetical protein